jgi:hypothetical protein
MQLICYFHSDVPQRLYWILFCISCAEGNFNNKIHVLLFSGYVFSDFSFNVDIILMYFFFVHIHCI